MTQNLAAELSRERRTFTLEKPAQTHSPHDGECVAHLITFWIAPDREKRYAKVFAERGGRGPQDGASLVKSSVGARRRCVSTATGSRVNSTSAVAVALLVPSIWSSEVTDAVLVACGRSCWRCDWHR